ncbi:HAD hydrolase family protein [Candidatus Actinomarina sp.]|nr:HAD hydrolase family protein [Candidatus Actinomarina sp.]
MKKIDNLTFLLDVDGVLTSGNFFYSSEGKVLKEFGPHDAYSLKSLSKFMHISFISADFRGFEITQKRIEDMGFGVKLVSEEERFEYVSKNYNFDDLIYMGDGDADKLIIKESFMSIAPNNARPDAKNAANFVTKCNGGEGAVAEAIDWIILKLKL